MRRGLIGLLVYVLLWKVSSTYPVGQLSTSHEDIQIPDSSDIEQHKEQIRSDENGQVISVRITSSVAVQRGRKGHERSRKNHFRLRQTTARTHPTSEEIIYSSHDVSASEQREVTVLPPTLTGANVEFIKQLRTKMTMKSGPQHPYHSIAISPIKDSVAQATTFTEEEQKDNDYEHVPRARSFPLSPMENSLNILPKNNKTHNPYRNSTTSVSFNIVHSHLPRIYSEPARIYGEQSKLYGTPSKFYSEPSKVYSNQERFYSEQAKNYGEPSKVYSEPAKIYGQPELFYSEPAKVYGEPSKIYSEPSKIYGEPAKIYSEPAKVYGEPSKVYSEPASLHLEKSLVDVTTIKYVTTTNLSLNSEIAQKDVQVITKVMDELPTVEKNYDITEILDVQKNKVPVNKVTTEIAEVIDSDKKVGYVESDDFRKYRVEERTPDGFIVGEYGVVSNNDGSLRGVRYTADGDTNPRLIYEALVKFLHLTK